VSAFGGKAVIRTDKYLAIFRALRKQQSSVRFSPKRTFRSWKFADIEGLLSARSRHCNESVFARCSKPFAGTFGGLPDGGVRIFSADDGEEPISFSLLSGLLACADGGKTWIVV